MDRKQKLLDRENNLLKEIQYYEKRIELALNKDATNICNDSDSSDLEYEIKVNNEPSLLDLKLEKKKLQTCLLATIELTDVAVIQFEINIVPDDLVFDREPPILEPGVWKEIVAECRIGMIPFTINFFTHKANRLFAPILFRNLQVLPIKKPQEMELSRSVLSRVTQPSDAIQVLRSYESAYRSRRTTLAKLSEKYVEFVSIEYKVDGGYIVKCDNILNLTWFLQNKYSYLSRFQHKMSFDLEFIDESYVKIIRKANKKLENQSIQTEERTQLLCAIIDACLKAKGVLESHSESDNERIQPPSETTEQTIMAPPKTLPKKSKKNKENLVEINPKTATTDQVLKANNGYKDAPQKKNDTDENKDAQSKNRNSNLNNNTENGSEKRMNEHKIKILKKNVAQQKTKDENVASNDKKTNKEKPGKNEEVGKKPVANSKKNQMSENESVKTGNANKVINNKNQGKGTEIVFKDGNVASKNIQILENKIIKTGSSNNDENAQNKKRKIEVTQKLPVKKMKTSTNVAITNIVESKKQSANINDGIQKSNSNKDRVAISKKVNSTNSTEKTKIPTSTAVNKNNENSKPKQNTKENTEKTTLDDKISVPNKNAQIINKPPTENIASKVKKLQPNPTNKVTKPNVTNTQKTGNKKLETNGNTQKEKTSNNVEVVEKMKSIGSASKSKIPQKRPYTHRNPLEITVKPTQMKQPSGLGVKSSKPTNIPIAKRP